MNGVKWLRLSFLLMLALGLLTPAVAQAQELNDSQEPGSVLVFHRFTRGAVTIDGVAAPRTEIEISVTCPKGSEPCEEFQDVKLKAHWVCPGSQVTETKFICTEVDFNLFTTVKGTISINPENIPPFTQTVPAPPACPAIPGVTAPSGYLIVWVVDAFDRPIKYDALIGNAVVRDARGAAGAYNAVPIQALSTLATGDFTDVDGDGALDFDGATEYQAVTGRIFGTVRYPTVIPPAVATQLTLLTLDVKSNRPNYPTFVDFHFFTFNEILISFSTEFICWGFVALPTGLSQEVLGSVKGLFESVRAEKVPIFGIDDTAGPVTLLAIVETLEVNAAGTALRQYSYSTYNDSVAVPTTFEP